MTVMTLPLVMTALVMTLSLAMTALVIRPDHGAEFSLWHVAATEIT